MTPEQQQATAQYRHRETKYACATLWDKDMTALTSRTQPPEIIVNWESVSDSPEAAKQYADEWHDERVLIVELNVEWHEVARHPEGFTIRGEAEKPAPTLF